jgi:hypothetical protein
MATRHQGQTEGQALIANIERQRQLITHDLLQFSQSGEFTKKIRHFLVTNPLKLTSAAILAGFSTVVLLRRSSRKTSRDAMGKKIIFRLIKWLINQIGNTVENPEKGQSGDLAPFERRFIDAIWSIFK